MIGHYCVCEQDAFCLGDGDGNQVGCNYVFFGVSENNFIFDWCGVKVVEWAGVVEEGFGWGK